MAKRMKLITETLFNQFKNPKYNHESELIEKQEQVLSSKQMPDDVKAMLYENILRQLRNKEESDMYTAFQPKIPIIPSSTATASKATASSAEEETETDETGYNLNIFYKDTLKGRGQSIVNYFKKAGITWNEFNEVVIDGLPILNSEINDIIVGLKASCSKTIGALGMQKVMSKLREHEIPDKLFTKGVFNVIFASTEKKNTRKRRQSGDGLKKDAKHMKIIKKGGLYASGIKCIKWEKF
jgi:hypothetical protein